MIRLSSKNDESSLCYDVIIKQFGVFSSDIHFKTKMDIFRDNISLIINQSHFQATEGSIRRTQSVRQPRSASKRSALVVIIMQSKLRYFLWGAIARENMLDFKSIDFKI